MIRNKKYQDFLMEQLQDQKVAIAYLTAALEENFKEDEESQQILLIALRNIAEVYDSIGPFFLSALSPQFLKRDLLS